MLTLSTEAMQNNEEQGPESKQPIKFSLGCVELILVSKELTNAYIYIHNQAC